jgi:putative hydrolase of the HAD superfamily
MGKINSKNILPELFKAINLKKIILLDLDNTIYDYDSCHNHAIKTCYGFYSKNIEKISFRNFLGQYNKSKNLVKVPLKNQAASHSRLLYFQKMLEIIFKKSMIKESLMLEDLYWKSFLSKIKLYKWVMPFLKYCKKNKKKIVIVTDLCSQIQFRKLIKFGISNHIDFIVSSEEAGVEKPDPFIFSYALKKVSGRRKESVIIGDSSDKDRAKNIKTIILMKL